MLRSPVVRHRAPGPRSSQDLQAFVHPAGEQFGIAWFSDGEELVVEW
jgi:hypothetical protein